MSPTGPWPRIALGLAAVAVVLAGIATVVVVTRSDRPRPAAVTTTSAVSTRQVSAMNVVRLKRDAEVATVHGVIGLRVSDEELRGALGLEQGDLITAISGRAIKATFDIYDVLLGTSMMSATALYVEISRAGAPVLVRWELDGDLRSARYADVDLAAGPVRSDPLADSVIKLDDTSFKVPRSTVDAVLGGSSTVTKTIRVVPAIKAGVPEGLKLYAITPGSVFAAIGLENGDTLRMINNRRLTTPDSALDVYAALKGADHLVIEVDRRGAPVTISITVTN